MARLCENPDGCTRVATNTVPRFMGSVWLCPGCTLADAEPTPDMQTGAVHVESYVHVRDLGVSGRVQRITRAGTVVVEYFRDGMTRLAYRHPCDIVLL